MRCEEPDKKILTSGTESISVYLIFVHVRSEISSKNSHCIQSAGNSQGYSHHLKHDDGWNSGAFVHGGIEVSQGGCQGLSVGATTKRHRAWNQN